MVGGEVEVFGCCLIGDAVVRQIAVYDDVMT
jgi:hypothetical protein